MAKSELKSLYENKKLIKVFAIMDLKLRYKNSILGFLWSILEPLILLSVLYVVFTYVFASQIENFPLYLLLGIIIWNSFTRATTSGMYSIFGRSGLVSTIYLPRAVLPISAVTTSFLMMFLEFVILAGFMIALQFLPPATIVILPLILLLLFMVSVGMSLMLSIIYLKFKDVAHIWQLVVYAGFFVTPIIYSLEVFPNEIRNIIMLNPLAQIVEMSHNVVLYGILPDFQDVVYTTVVCVGVFFIGLIIFWKKEPIALDEL